MTNILVLNISVSRDASVSRTLVDYTIERLLLLKPEAAVIARDLGDRPVPHLTSDTVLGVRGVPGTDAERGTQALSDELIGEVRSADVLVIGAPMYNFSIPTSLRAWFDHVLRPRVTFSYSEAGPEGLLTGKRAVVILSRGGLYSEGPAKAIDFQEPYLRQLLGFVGITDVAFVYAERIGFGPEAREAALAGAKARIDKLAARIASGEPVLVLIERSSAQPVDYDAIMQANLVRVFGEHDPSRRIEAIRELYHADASLLELDRAVHGHEAISQVVTDLLAHLPPRTAFTAVRPASGHHGVGRLQWRSVSPGAEATITGTDVARVDEGRIRSLHVFLDEQGYR